MTGYIYTKKTAIQRGSTGNGEWVYRLEPCWLLSDDRLRWVWHDTGFFGFGQGFDTKEKLEYEFNRMEDFMQGNVYEYQKRIEKTLRSEFPALEDLKNELKLFGGDRYLIPPCRYFGKDAIELMADWYETTVEEIDRYYKGDRKRMFDDYCRLMTAQVCRILENGKYTEN